MGGTDGRGNGAGKTVRTTRVARTTVAATQRWLAQWRFRRLWMASDTQKRAPVIEKPGADETPAVQSLSREKPDRWAAGGALASCPEKKSAVQSAFADCTADLCQTRIPPRGVEGTLYSGGKAVTTDHSGTDSGTVNFSPAAGDLVELLRVLAALTPEERQGLLSLARELGQSKEPPARRSRRSRS